MSEGQRIALERRESPYVHITQDDFGYWMMTLETPDGELHLMMSALDDSADPIGHAYNPHELDLAADTKFLISETQRPIDLHAEDWHVPEPRRAEKPYYIVQGGKRIDG